MPVLKIRKSVKIWCSNSKISIFASPGKFSNMENIHTMAKKYPYGYEKKFPKIFDFRDMPCHKYFEWLVPCLLKVKLSILNSNNIFLGGLFCYNYAPLSIPELPNAIDRIIFTIQWHSLTVLVLFRMVEVLIYNFISDVLKSSMYIKSYLHFFIVF